MATASHLSTYFRGVVLKKLTAVEAEEERSNQHEINGVAEMKRVLGPEKRIFEATFIYLAEEEDEEVAAQGELTWYDARKKHPKRSEWRLYLPDNAVYERAAEGDLLAIGRRPDDVLLVIVARGGSTAENQLKTLFGYDEDRKHTFTIRDIREQDEELSFTAKLLLQLIGIEILETAQDALEDMLRRWGGAFPRTMEFSAYARRAMPRVSSLDDPDAALVAWIDREETLFRTLERHLVWSRIEAGFTEVDDFIEFSLSVHNRRKSRAGYAMENHLEQIFKDYCVAFSRGAVTENRARPDFLFPGISQYRDTGFPDNRLNMLGVKSTCKDRWRQVLSEAHRVKQKHLITLEPGISENQTAEMQASSLQLVLPKGVHSTFTENQQRWLIDLKVFLEVVRARGR